MYTMLVVRNKFLKYASDVHNVGCEKSKLVVWITENINVLLHL